MGLEEKEVQYVRRRWRKMAGEQFLERVRERERDWLVGWRERRGWGGVVFLYLRGQTLYL